MFEKSGIKKIEVFLEKNASKGPIHILKMFDLSFGKKWELDNAVAVIKNGKVVGHLINKSGNFLRTVFISRELMQSTQQK